MLRCWVAPQSFLRVTSKAAVEVRSELEASGAVEVTLFVPSFPNNRKSFLLKMVLKFQRMPRKGFAI